MRKATFKAVLTIHQSEYPEEHVKFEHESRFNSRAECKAALTAIRRDAEALLSPFGDRFSIDVGVMEKRRTVATHN